MNKIHHGFFQVGAIILVASVFAAGLVVNKFKFNSLEAAGGCGTNKTQGSCNGSCSPNKGKDNKSFECKWVGGSCKESAKECRGGSSGVPTVPGNSKESCEQNKGFWCAGCGGFCLSGSYQNGGCNQAQMEKCGQPAVVGSVSCICISKNSDGTCSTWTSSDGNTESRTQCRDRCPSGGTSCSFGTGAYICSLNHSGACTSANGKPFKGNLNGCFCGVVQVDSANGHTTYKNNCGCENKTPNPQKTFTPKPSPSPSPTPQKTKTPKPTKTPTLTPTITPTSTVTASPSPTVTPVAEAKLKLCKYEDKNGNGSKDSDEKTISWKFMFKYQDKEYTAQTPWWDIIGDRCITVNVPANQWIRVWEESKSGWSLTNIIVDGSGVGGTEYNYVSSSNTQKEVFFLNKSTPGTTPTPTVMPTSTPTTPPVLGATAPPTLPKTGVNGIQIVAGLTGLMAAGYMLFRRFKLV